jgi:hypothetical protein
MSQLGKSANSDGIQGEEASQQLALSPNDHAVQLPVLSFAVDNIALTARMNHEPDLCCSWCEQSIQGLPSASGLLMWSRGNDDLRFDEPPLCSACSNELREATVHYLRCQS